MIDLEVREGTMPMRERAWLALGMAGLAVGAVLVRRGWGPRRLGTRRRCAACGYDLTGNESGRCPECGAELGEGRVTVGERRRRPGVAAMGLCVLIVGVGVVGYPGVERLWRVNWYRYRPAGWVAEDLSSADVAVAERAWEELERRRKEGGLSEETEGRVAEAALAEQAKAHVPENVAPPSLFKPMMQYLSDRCFAGKLTEGQRERFFRQAFRAELKVRPVVVSGETVNATVIPTGNGVGDERWTSSVEWGAFSVGERKKGPSGGVWDQGIQQRTRLGTFVVAGGAGPQVVTWSLPVTISQSTGGLGHDGPTVARFDRVLRAQTMVEAAPSSSNPKLVRDLTLANAVRASTLIALRSNRTSSGTSDPEIDIRIENPPIGVAFDVVVRIAGGTFTVDQSMSEPVACAKGGSYSHGFRFSRLRGVAAADVVLRSSGKVARQTNDLFEIWDGELVLKGVPVEDGE